MKKKDPTSHRIIEKRRRDRMNNCLTDLSRLIPAQYIRKGRGRVEKTEIIEMAIKYLKDLIEGGGACCACLAQNEPRKASPETSAVSQSTGAHQQSIPSIQQATSGPQINNHLKQQPLANNKRRNSMMMANDKGSSFNCNSNLHCEKVARESSQLEKGIEMDIEFEVEEDDVNNQQENKDASKLTNGNNSCNKLCSISNTFSNGSSSVSQTSSSSSSPPSVVTKIDRLSPNSSNSTSSESSLSSSGFSSSENANTNSNSPQSNGLALEGALDMTFHEHSIVSRFSKTNPNGQSVGIGPTGSGNNSSRSSQVVAWYKKVLLVRAYSRSQQR